MGTGILVLHETVDDCQAVVLSSVTGHACSMS